MELRSDQRAIHNFLISSYATSSEEGQYSKLISYLKQQARMSNGSDRFC